MRELFALERRRICHPAGADLSCAGKTREDWSITGEKERMNFFGQEDHVRIYGQDYGGRLRAAGFSVTATLPRDFLSADQIRECSLLEEEKVFFCEKK